MPYKNDNLEDLFKKAGKHYPLSTDNSNWESVESKMRAAAKKQTTRNFLKYTIIILLISVSSILFYQLKLNTSSLNKGRLDKQQFSQKLPSDKSDKSLAAKQNQTQFTVDVKAGNPVKNSNVNNNSSTAINEQQVSIDPVMAVLNRKEFSADITRCLNAHNVLAVLPVISNKIDALKNENKTYDKALHPITVDDAASANKNQSSKQAEKFKPSYKIYGSLYGSPEFSAVKFQLINTGFRAGVALGYKINQRFNVEIGLQRDRIKYYTNGKYFDKSGLKLKETISLEKVNGESKLTSIPVTVKYNFLPNKKGNFYVAAGTNAVVVSHLENYDYTVSKNGNTDDRSRNYKSVTAPKYFSSINTAAGYQTNFSAWCNFKIEPYYQIPIKNLGVGKLPVSNFGVNFGIVKDLK